jgi:hypothetical protein
MVVAHECVEIAFILVFWPFGRGYEPRPDKRGWFVDNDNKARGEVYRTWYGKLLAGESQARHARLALRRRRRRRRRRSRRRRSELMSDWQPVLAT